MNTFARILVLGGLAALALAAAACGDDDDGGGGGDAEKQAVEAAVRAFEKADGDEDVKAYLDAVTDNFIESVFGAFGVKRDDILKNPEGFLGDDSVAEIEKVSVSGNKATVLAFLPGEAGGDRSAVAAGLVKRDGKWRMDSVVVRKADTPKGARVANVEMKEFTFKFDDAGFKSGTPLVIRGKNAGKQTHVIVMSKIPDDADLKKLLEFEGEGNPPGVEDVAGGFFFASGKEGDIILDKGITPGRYAIICFLPDTSENKGFEGTPHFEKGMRADFRVK